MAHAVLTRQSVILQWTWSYLVCKTPKASELVFFQRPGKLYPTVTTLFTGLYLHLRCLLYRAKVTQKESWRGASNFTELCKYFKTNTDHRVVFHNLEVVGNGNNCRRLQILESLLTHFNLNTKIPAIPLCIFNLQPSFVHHAWRHTLSLRARILLNHVIANASRHVRHWCQFYSFFLVFYSGIPPAGFTKTFGKLTEACILSYWRC